MLYMVTFTIHIPQMLAYIPYMDPMGLFLGGNNKNLRHLWNLRICLKTQFPPQIHWSEMKAMSSRRNSGEIQIPDMLPSGQ